MFSDKLASHHQFAQTPEVNIVGDKLRSRQAASIGPIGRFWLFTAWDFRQTKKLGQAIMATGGRSAPLTATSPGHPNAPAVVGPNSGCLGQVAGFIA